MRSKFSQPTAIPKSSISSNGSGSSKHYSRLDPTRVETNNRPTFDEIFPAALPEFESEADCRRFREQVREADLMRKGEGYGPPNLLRECFEDEPCNSGLCNVCMRQARFGLLKFAYEERILERDCWFVTIFISYWTVRAGSHLPFGGLGDHKLVRRLLQAIRRLKRRDVLVIGTIETVYKVIGNVPQGKPFHLHFLVWGLEKQEVEDVVRKCLPLDNNPPRPLNIQSAGASEVLRLRRLSYVFKQPLWKSSKVTAGDLDRCLQWPKPGELAELISNLGAHQVYARLFTLGIRRDRVRFRRVAICNRVKIENRRN